MIIASTYFARKDMHKGTMKSPDGLTVNMIDHVIVDSRHQSNIINVRTRRGQMRILITTWSKVG
ncbi:unnamed protein product [Diabrotica balteata]|uniref:Uncharacterized protein n=1 Tax=Diabrotica balteata TaxID=107213 RepID=A0A9N9SWY5_DIABA|nr:unnamed protein product [Diabrotica balteata]